MLSSCCHILAKDLSYGYGKFGFLKFKKNTITSDILKIYEAIFHTGLTSMILSRSIYIRYVFFLLLITVIAIPSAHAGKIIHGHVTDVETGNGLPVAHVHILGTRTGTITNDDGSYSLEIETLPATILISYIGYTSEKLIITEQSPGEQNSALTPNPLVMEEIVVSAEDPAVRIMKEVIRRKKIWRASLETYKAEAYTRVILGNDSTIVSISESITEISWEKGKGPREVVKAKRQTNNMKADQNIALARMIPNLYDDDISVAGYRVIGPTHPDALKYYEFKLTGRRKIDEKIVFDISLTPKSRLQPSFVGTISVLDEEYALINTDLKPNESIVFPMPIQDVKLSFRQQFSNFGGDYWLPVDARNEGEIKIKFPGLTFPAIKYRQLTRLTDYKVNVALTDSLMDKKAKEEVFGTTEVVDDSANISAGKQMNTIRDDSAKTDSDSLFAAKEGGIVPYTEEEETAYSTIDSTMTMEKAFKPTGFLMRFLDDDEEKEKEKNQSGPGKVVSKVFSVVSPQLGFNRVDGAYLGLKHKKTIKKRFTYVLDGAYTTGQELWSYGGRIQYRWGKNRRWSAGANGGIGTDTRYNSENYQLSMNGIRTLMGRNDYFDYYRNKKWHADCGYRLRKFKTALTAGINIEHHTSLEKSTDYNILNSDRDQRDNPAVDEDRLRSLDLTLEYGGEKVPFGIIGQNRVEFAIEHSSPDVLSSDFSFTKYQLMVDWRINTFLQRRLLPNALDVKVIGGTFSGDLPVQRFGIVDGVMSRFGPFGVLRSLEGHPLEGEKYGAVFMEHNFRTVPFELAGLRWFVKKGTGIILHGAAGRTWISKKRLSELTFKPYYYDGLQSEIGLSLNSLFGFFRVDVTKRLDKHGVFVGFGAARLF